MNDDNENEYNKPKVVSESDDLAASTHLCAYGSSHDEESTTHLLDGDNKKNSAEDTPTDTSPIDNSVT